MVRSLTRAEGIMRSLGWEFFQVGPNEGKWLKFDTEGNIVARQGDKIWKKDCDKARF